MSFSKNKILVFLASVTALGLASCSQPSGNVPVHNLNNGQTSTYSSGNNLTPVTNPIYSNNNSSDFANYNQGATNNPSFNIPTANNPDNANNNYQGVTANCNQVIPAYNIIVPKFSNGKPNYSRIAQGSYKGTTYVVKPGDTLYLVGYLVGKSAGDVANLNHLPQDASLDPGTTLLVNPVGSNCNTNPNNAATPNNTANSAQANQANTTPVPTTQQVPSVTKVTKETLKGTKEVITNNQATAKQIADRVENQAKNAGKNAVNKVESAVNSAKNAAGKVVNTAKNTLSSNDTIVPASSSDNTVAAKVNGTYHGSTPLTWPTNGKLIGVFSTAVDKQHGLTFAGNSGDPIYAATSGVVSYAGTFQGYGNIVLIRNDKTKMITLYAHNSKLLVSTGESVTQGEKIALLGNSGTDRYKLYFELRVNGTSKDPLKYLPPRK